MDVITIPCLEDNYAYLLICSVTRHAAVVDPSEAAPVQEAVERLGVQLKAILNTHHHWDHVGGNLALVEAYPGLSVYGYETDRGRIPGQTHFLTEADTVAWGELEASITHNPGHTTGAVSYWVEDCGFTGDTLFAAGCGRLFEGTPEQMWESLTQKIGSRDPATKLYFGHEYTMSNLVFAQSVEPRNAKIKGRLYRVGESRRSGGVSTPTTIAQEWATNPFMRCDSPEIQQAVKKVDPDNDLTPGAVLGCIREMKNRS